jgi:hypothetical protein
MEQCARYRAAAFDPRAHLMQYRLPLASGRLCPKCVPSAETASPVALSTRMFSQTTSWSRNEGQPWVLLSEMNSAIERPIGATKSGLPVTLS